MNWSQEKFTNLLSSLGPFCPSSLLYMFFVSSYALLFLIILEIIQFAKIEKICTWLLKIWSTEREEGGASV